MTALSSPVRRVTAARYCSRNLVVIIAACGGQPEARIGVRQKGKRTAYTATVSDFYRWAASLYAAKERSAKRAARKQGLPWKQAKKRFIAENTI